MSYNPNDPDDLLDVTIRHPSGSPQFVFHIPVSSWEGFLARMVKRNMTEGDAVTEAIDTWAQADHRWGEK